VNDSLNDVTQRDNVVNIDYDTFEQCRLTACQRDVTTHSSSRDDSSVDV
jgi:hypothetical protein